MNKCKINFENKIGTEVIDGALLINNEEHNHTQRVHVLYGDDDYVATSGFVISSGRIAASPLIGVPLPYRIRSCENVIIEINAENSDGKTALMIAGHKGRIMMTGYKMEDDLNAD